MLHAHALSHDFYAIRASGNPSLAVANTRGFGRSQRPFPSDLEGAAMGAARREILIYEEMQIAKGLAGPFLSITNLSANV